MSGTPPPDYVIAREALAKIRPIDEIARSLDLPTDPAHFFSYGGRYAKVSNLLSRGREEEKPRGKVILVTGMNPTPAGSGKTLTTIALADSLNLVLQGRGEKRRATFVLREPSEGPTLSVKGGACGGGYSQVIPMEDINLEFTGDIPAVTQAHNLLWAVLMARLASGPAGGHIPADGIEWSRAEDLCDRSLRRLLAHPEGKMGPLVGGSQRIVARTIISAASEVMAVLGLARDMGDLGERLSRIRVARHENGTAVTAGSLGVVGAMQAILRRAFNPNLVQTIAGTGGFIHTGPFANIAHGNSSLVALELARRHADLVVTEGGFGADLGAQKFFDVVCRLGGIRPVAAVLVCSTRDLKYQGGAEPIASGGSPGARWRFAPDREACRRGIENLEVHADILRTYGVRVVVAINRFAWDDEEELKFCLSEIRERVNVPAVWHNGYAEGAKGGTALAEKILKEVEAAGEGASFRLLYPDDAPLRHKLETVAHRIYRADGVDYAPAASQVLDEIESTYGPRLNVVLSKTQFSLSDDKSLRGVPRGRRVRVTGVLYRGGAGWATALLGDVLLMPGMDYETCAARRLSLKADPGAFGGSIVENLQ